MGYSRKNIVASTVALVMLLTLLLWHQQENVSILVSSSLYNADTKASSNINHKHNQHKHLHDPTSPIPPPVVKETPQSQELQKQINDDQEQDLYEAKTETSPIKNGGKKTKDRFWTSNGHLLPSVWDYKRPKNIKIMGLVFYGRRQSVSILDCYLKRNLAKNGGMLDGVIFVERTKDALDLGLLHRLLESEPAYEKWHIGMAEDDQFASGFGNSYDRIEDDVLYIKMDDDIVFMEDSVIPSIIQKKVEHPEHYIVSANVVNQPLLSWVHWSLNAVKPYLPELNRTSPMINSSMDWRPSQLPYWTEYQNFNLDEWEPSDHGLHRWLPLNRTKHNILDNTPIKQAEYNAFGRGWTQWKMGAQEHYSFLENLEKDELWQYKFDTWDFQFERMGIQFIAMMGHDINIAKPIEADDENHFSCTMTRQLGRGAVADGRGLAVHYSFGSQREGMRKRMC